MKTIDQKLRRELQHQNTTATKGGERHRTKTNAATSEQSNTNVHNNKLKKKNEIGGLQKVRKISPEDNDVKLREKKYCKCGGGIYKQRSASKVHWESERPTYKLTLT